MDSLSANRRVMPVSDSADDAAGELPRCGAGLVATASTRRLQFTLVPSCNASGLLTARPDFPCRIKRHVEFVKRRQNGAATPETAMTGNGVRFPLH